MCTQARSDAEMPEVLLGGGTICRPNPYTATRIAWSSAGGCYTILSSVDPASTSGSRDFTDSRDQGQGASRGDGVSTAARVVAVAVAISVLLACALSSDVFGHLLRWSRIESQVGSLPS